MAKGARLRLSIAGSGSQKGEETCQREFERASRGSESLPRATRLLCSIRSYERDEIVRGDVSILLFHYIMTQRACREFIDWLKKSDMEVTTKQLSSWTRCRKGSKGLPSRRESFYRLVLKKLMRLSFFYNEVPEEDHLHRDAPTDSN